MSKLEASSHGFHEFALIVQKSVTIREIRGWVFAFSVLPGQSSQPKVLEYAKDQHNICDDGDRPLARGREWNDIRKDQHCASKHTDKVAIDCKPGNARMHRFCPRRKIEFDRIYDHSHANGENDPGSRHAEKAGDCF